MQWCHPSFRRRATTNWLHLSCFENEESRSIRVFRDFFVRLPQRIAIIKTIHNPRDLRVTNIIYIYTYIYVHIVTWWIDSKNRSTDRPDRSHGDRQTDRKTERYVTETEIRQRSDGRTFGGCNYFPRLFFWEQDTCCNRNPTVSARGPMICSVARTPRRSENATIVRQNSPLRSLLVDV